MSEFVILYQRLQLNMNAKKSLIEVINVYLRSLKYLNWLRFYYKTKSDTNF